MNGLNNKVTLVGNLGFDPEVREVSEGRKVARISIATNERYKNAAGEWQDDTQWHTVVAWGASAERVERLLHKGDKVHMEGKLVHRSYEAKDGTKRFVTEVVLRGFNLIVPAKPKTSAEAA